MPFGNNILQYVSPNNCRKVWWCFLMNFWTFWRSWKCLLNSPKLSCGCNSVPKWTKHAQGVRVHVIYPQWCEKEQKAICPPKFKAFLWLRSTGIYFVSFVLTGLSNYEKKNASSRNWYQLPLDIILSLK